MGVAEQPAVADDFGGEGILAAGEQFHGQRLPPPQGLQDAQVGAGEQADVVAMPQVLRVEALGDDQADARGELGEQGGLPGSVGAVALPGYDHLEPTPDHCPFGDGEAASAVQPKVREVLQPLPEVVAHPGGGDLIHRDLIAQG